MKRQLPTDAHPFEVIEKANKTQPKAKRIEFLKVHADFATRTILQLNFDENIKLDLPEGAPPYNKLAAEPGIVPTPPSSALSNLGDLLPQNKAMDSVTKEKRFIETLESLHPKDAELLIAAKDGKITEAYQNMSKFVYTETFKSKK